MSGFTILDAVEIRAATALTSSYVAATVYRVQVRGLSFSVACTYTRGAAGGYPSFRIYWSRDGVTLFSDPTFGTTITDAQPYGQQQIYGNEFPGPQPADGSAFLFLIPSIGRPDGADYFHILAKEGSGLANGTLKLEIWPEITVE